MRLKIAARQSDLARLQAQSVGDALKAAHGAAIEIEFQFRPSLGDLNQQDPLWKMPEKGVFTDDFLEDLKNDRVDLVVHSWKDLPTEERAHTHIAATLPRADARDLLLVRTDRLERITERRSLRVFTSSPRRAHNLENFLQSYLPLALNSVEFVTVRGNIPTRVRKLFSEDADALIVAKAAIDRLLSSDAAEYADVRQQLRKAIEQCRWAVLPLSLNPSAAAQGALAIEIKRGRTDLVEVLNSINCRETQACVEKERKILSSYGGGCHQKIGVTVLQRLFGEITFLRGLTDGGDVLDRVTLKAPRSQDASDRVDESRLWPLKPEPAFFRREALPKEMWHQKISQAKLLWVARETALPQEASIAPHQLVWCAGLQTWRKLAERGIWVNGSAEGLGESELPQIDIICGTHGQNERLASPPLWLKLTHDSSPQGLAANRLEALPTYRLVPIAQPPDLRDKSHFYWMSGSAFDRALTLYPQIASASHACGPGNTYAHVQSVLGSRTKVAVYLSHEDWLRHLTLQR